MTKQDIGVSVILAFIVLSLRVSALSVNAGTPATVSHGLETRQNGSSPAAADLYGIGIRIGIYLQSVGMLMSLVRQGRGSYKLAVSANTIAVLISWTILARRKTFSPCEAWLVLSILGVLFFPAGATLCNVANTAGEGIGIFLVVVSSMWLFISILWLFVSLIYRLPQLGTTNTAWIFVPVPLDGWFRVLMLVAASLFLLSSVLTAFGATLLIHEAMKCWYTGEDSDDDLDSRLRNMRKDVLRSSRWILCALEPKAAPWVLRWRLGVDRPIEAPHFYKIALCSFRWVLCGLGLFFWIFGIVSCEKIIRWNALEPETDLSKPGQTIPLVIGIFTTVDGIGSLLNGPRAW